MTVDFAAPQGGNRKWTLLLGENGCGKSSVLRAIAMLLAGSDALIDLLGDPDAWIRNGARQCRIEGVLTTADGERREVALQINRGDTLKRVLSRNNESLQALDAAIAHTQRNYFVLGYGVSRRPPSNNKHAGVSDDGFRSPRARGLATMFSPDAGLVSLEQWAMDLEYRRGAQALKAVRFALDHLLPDMVFRKIDRENRQIMFTTPDGPVPLNQLSDGYQNMAAWCGDLLYRITEAFPDRKNPLETRGVLLVDELDLHLHPIWRRQLVVCLNATLPNFQVIATTHSALTAQQSGEGELFVIHRAGKNKRPALVPFVGEPRRMMLHQLLMSPMFGLESMDSVEIEQARSGVRALANKSVSSRTAAEAARLQQLRKVLKGAPSWDAVPKYEREQTALIKEVKAALRSRGATKKVSPVKLKAKVKALGVVG